MTKIAREKSLGIVLLGVVALSPAHQVPARLAAEGVVALVAEDVVGPFGADQRVFACQGDPSDRGGAAQGTPGWECTHPGCGLGRCAGTS